MPDPSTTEVSERTKVHPLHGDDLFWSDLMESIDWLTGQPCTVTRGEYELGVTE